MPQHLVIVFGPPAVGKMTVAYALAERTGFKVLHNHMTIELLMPLFEHGTTEFQTLNREFRLRIFEAAAQSTMRGFIFTYVWGLARDTDRAFIDTMTQIFTRQGWRVHFVELAASLEARLHRNQTPFRLSQKPSKRDVATSEARLRKLVAQEPLNSNGDFFYPEQHLKLETTSLPAADAATQIISHFALIHSQ